MALKTTADVGYIWPEYLPQSGNTSTVAALSRQSTTLFY